MIQKIEELLLFEKEEEESYKCDICCVVKNRKEFFEYYHHSHICNECEEKQIERDKRYPMNTIRIARLFRRPSLMDLFEEKQLSEKSVQNDNKD